MSLKALKRRDRKVDNVVATVTSWGRLFQCRLPEAEKARSPAAATNLLVCNNMSSVMCAQLQITGTDFKSYISLFIH